MQEKEPDVQVWRFVEVYCMRVTSFYPVTKSQVTHKLKLSELCKPSKILSSIFVQKTSKVVNITVAIREERFCHRQ